MPVNRVVMSIHDDQVGCGTELAFPTMGSCCACICVQDHQIVGIHKTQGWLPNHTTLFNYAVHCIGMNPVRKLYLAGWNMDVQNAHDITQIRQQLNCANVPTYQCNFSNHQITINNWQGDVQVRAFKGGMFKNPTRDLCTFAYLQGTELVISVKRTEKVKCIAAASRKGLQPPLGVSARFMGSQETLETPSDKLTRLQFQRVR